MLRGRGIVRDAPLFPVGGVSWKLALRVLLRILPAHVGCACCSLGFAEAGGVKAARRRGCAEGVEGAGCDGCVRCAAAVVGGCAHTIIFAHPPKGDWRRHTKKSRGGTGNVQPSGRKNLAVQEESSVTSDSSWHPQFSMENEPSSLSMSLPKEL